MDLLAELASELLGTRRHWEYGSMTLGRKVPDF